MILAPTPENIERTAAHLREGGIAAIPTETVYGLAANALDSAACAQVFASKERPTFDPLIVHLAAQQDTSPFETLRKSGLIAWSFFSTDAIQTIEALAHRFWPGPLTLVLPKTEAVPDLVTAGLPSVAVRFPSHPVAQALLRATDRPLAAPSANRFGRISPTQAEHVFEELGDRVEWILDGGPCEVGLESTVLQVQTNGELTLLRPGKVSAEEIVLVAGRSVRAGTARLDAGPQVAPGMLASHYAPRKPLFILPLPVANLSEGHISAIQKHPGKIGLLALSGNTARLEEELSRRLDGRPVRALSLSENGDLAKAAQNLFAVMRELDRDPELSFLVSEPAPEGSGLAHAIRDRLGRAGKAL